MQETIPRQIRGRPMFLGEAKEILKVRDASSTLLEARAMSNLEQAFKESLLTPAVVRSGLHFMTNF